MLHNLFQCPIELFEAYPIGRILNRLSCDMFVIGELGSTYISLVLLYSREIFTDQKLPSCVQRLVLVSLICLSAIAVNCIQVWLVLLAVHSLMRIPFSARSSSSAFCPSWRSTGGYNTSTGCQFTTRKLKKIIEFYSKGKFSFILFAETLFIVFIIFIVIELYISCI